MPLDPHDSNPIYHLGRLAGLASKHHVRLPLETVDTALARPAAGLALITRAITAARDPILDEAAGHIINGLMDLPDGPTRIEDQGPYWMGYYHQRHGMRVAMTVDDLRAAGQQLYGEQWQSDLARALGIDSRRVREWLERRSVPAWVRAEIYGLLMTHSRAAAAMAEQLAQAEDD